MQPPDCSSHSEAVAEASSPADAHVWLSVSAVIYLELVPGLITIIKTFAVSGAACVKGSANVDITAQRMKQALPERGDPCRFYGSHPHQHHQRPAKPAIASPIPHSSSNTLSRHLYSAPPPPKLGERERKGSEQGSLLSSTVSVKPQIRERSAHSFRTSRLYLLLSSCGVSGFNPVCVSR